MDEAAAQIGQVIREVIPEESATPEKSTQQYEDERAQLNKDVLNKLDSGELQDQVTVILVLGPSGAGKTNLLRIITGEDLPVGHKLESGTVKSWAILMDFNDRRFLFIDTPGFGHPDVPTDKVKAAIFELLGYFTRRLGGIHGFLYLHDIRLDRTTPGMRESFKFLEELTGTMIPHSIFVTTGWDLIVSKEQPKCQARLDELIRKEWGKFRVGDGDGSRSRHHKFGVSWQDDTDTDKDRAREGLFEMIFNVFQSDNLNKLRMPFWETNFGNGVHFFFKHIKWEVKVGTPGPPYMHHRHHHHPSFRQGMPYVQGQGAYWEYGNGGWTRTDYSW